MPGRAIGGGVGRQRFAQSADLFLRVPAFVAITQVFLDLTGADQIELVIDMGVKRFANFVVVHLVFERIV
jgi:hypothetical protein